MNLKHCFLPGMLLIISLVVLSACEQSTVPDEQAIEPATTDAGSVAAASVTHIADRYYATMLEKQPELAYFSGVELARHDGMNDNSPAARRADSRPSRGPRLIAPVSAAHPPTECTTVEPAKSSNPMVSRKRPPHFQLAWIG